VREIIYDGTTRRWPKVGVENILNLLIGASILLVEGFLVSTGWLPVPWR
jgi:hypothetical protein